MKTRLFAVVIPAVASLAFAAPALAAPSGSSAEAVSENWAGYEATSSSGSGFSAASGSWVQPSVDCSQGSGYSAYWVGLGGGGQDSTALEQEGTQADCSASGQASYYAWYELVPSAPVKIKLAVHAGDKLWARTAVSGDRVTVQVDDKTTGQDFTKTLTMTSATPDTSTAEWVAEAPSECAGGASGQCTPLPLSDFGSVKFSDSYATSAGQTKSISGWNPQAIALSPDGGSAFGYGDGYGGGFGGGYGAPTTSNGDGAAPGALSADGTTFTVTYGDSYGYPGGYGDGGYSAAGYYGDAGGYGDGGYGDGDGGYGTGGYGGGYGFGAGGYGGGYGYGAGEYGGGSGFSAVYGY